MMLIAILRQIADNLPSNAMFKTIRIFWRIGYWRTVAKELLQLCADGHYDQAESHILDKWVQYKDVSGFLIGLGMDPPFIMRRDVYLNNQVMVAIKKTFEVRHLKLRQSGTRG